MTLSKAIEGKAGRIVIIDDKYLPLNFDFISEGALTTFFQALKQNPEHQRSLSNILGLGADSALNEMIEKVQADYSIAYAAYIGGEHPFLEPLFSELAEERQVDTRRLRMLESVIFERFKVNPSVFGSIDEARAHLADSSLVFLDFFLGGINNQEDARAMHASIKDELARPISVEGFQRPKLVVLMSTSLPDTQGLTHFRSDTGIRSAFFHSIDKKDFDKNYLDGFVSQISSDYESALKLNNYLVAVQHEIQSAANKLVAELQQRLDLHDLTILKTLRLDGESDTPQAYLTHLLAEVLAARLRVSPALRAEVLPKETAYGDVLFDGKVLPSSVLFEFFSDITVAPTPLDGSVKVAFGDIYEAVHGKDAGALYLAISPACDLQRCEDTYEVLCVPGAADAAADSLEKLFSGKYAFGDGNVVMRMPQTPAPLFKKFSFDWKHLRTIKASALKNGEEFKRAARMAEIFAQEVKTKALNHAARVGVPIDPSFSLELKVKVRYSIPGGRGEPKLAGEMQGLNQSYLCAVLAMGKEKDGELERTVMFSSQFRENLQKYIDERRRETPNVKLDKVAEHFSKASSYKIAFEGSKAIKRYGDVITFRYQEKLGSLDEPSGFEVYLFNELESDVGRVEGGTVSAADAQQTGN